MTGNQVIPIQCDIRDAIAVTEAVDACVDKVCSSLYENCRIRYSAVL